MTAKCKYCRLFGFVLTWQLGWALIGFSVCGGVAGALGGYLVFGYLGSFALPFIIPIGSAVDRWLFDSMSDR
jgi:hypothetical protein